MTIETAKSVSHSIPYLTHILTNVIQFELKFEYLTPMYIHLITVRNRRVLHKVTPYLITHIKVN